MSCLSSRFASPMILALLLPLAAAAQDAAPFRVLGFGAIGANDSQGDGNDRWRTSSGTVSVMLGHDWAGSVPVQFGQLLELRFGAQVFTPANLTSPRSDDRRYAGALTAGLHTYVAQGPLDMRLGADLVWVGEQTGLGDLQRRIHEHIPGQADPSNALVNQIPNNLHLSVSGEASRDIALGENTLLRPFIEARAGDETYLRIGADVMLAGFGQEALLARDLTTGHLYQGITGTDRGWGFVIGGDIAAVESSIYLPDDDTGPDVEPLRGRVRAGVQWQHTNWSLNFSLTYLTEEYDGQPQGQLLGSYAFSMTF